VHTWVVELVFQSSPDPKVGCCAQAIYIAERKGNVSILTRPEGRVLPQAAALPARVAIVSILTRPEGRVLLLIMAAIAIVGLFQSSPDPKVGCCVFG